MKTKKQLISLYGAMSTVVKNGNAKFKYGVLKNLKLIDSDIEALKTIEKEIAEILKPFEEKRSEIIKKYGTERENGTIAIEPTSENFEAAIKELKALEAEFKSDFEKHTAKLKEYESLLNEETETIALHEILIDNVPDEITDTEMKELMDWEIVE
jgi:hypothetical protein